MTNSVRFILVSGPAARTTRLPRNAMKNGEKTTASRCNSTCLLRQTPVRSHFGRQSLRQAGSPGAQFDSALFGSALFGSIRLGSAQLFRRSRRCLFVFCLFDFSGAAVQHFWLVDRQEKKRGGQTNCNRNVNDKRSTHTQTNTGPFCLSLLFDSIRSNSILSFPYQSPLWANT